MADDPIPLARVYAAMEEAIAQAIPGLHYVGTMPGMLQSIAVPGIVLELSGFEPADHDPGTGEVAIEARFEARAIVGAEHDDHLHVAAYIAAQLAVLLRMQTWGLEVEPAQLVRAEPDWSRPELDGLAAWVVEWTQVIYLGTEEWPWPNQPPGSLVWGFAPDTGPGSEGSYLPPEAME
ncbi:hypothetical protein [Pseudomonas chlororaphis]|uniref:hypothetical protein n=1 Tax=Pseudomonas chlororaphis TaxID=587753 RepID=UPI0015DDE073|nr:hypothetical protein [Pseudomonas chlororaphis]QLL15391.1 hypothetical protein H0I86_09965 [Pseudomonas chlororaphis subsp. aurantiaca]